MNDLLIGALTLSLDMAGTFLIPSYNFGSVGENIILPVKSLHYYLLISKSFPDSESRMPDT